MVGLTSFLNTKVPVVNRWEENLEIASRQVQNKISGVMERRLNAMSEERASVAELMLLAQHAVDRLSDPMITDQAMRDRLRKIAQIASPVLHCAGYKPNVFENSNLAAQMPGHLNVMSAWNMATELASHTHEVTKSSDLALDKLANRLCFDREDISKHSARYSTTAGQSVFDDNESAFFADMRTDGIDDGRIIS
jgi:hypothetical protein